MGVAWVVELCGGGGAEIVLVFRVPFFNRVYRGGKKEGLIVSTLY